MFYRPHKRVSINCGDVMMTKQSHKDECDINRILRQYQRTGIVTHVQAARGIYTDLPDVSDYQQSLHVMMEAERAFAALPAKVRDHFGNDPAQFLAAFGDASQADKLREFGLLNSPSPPLPSPEAPAPSSQDGA